MKTLQTLTLALLLIGCSRLAPIDNQIVINLSYNWSKQAETKNDETVVVHEDKELASKFSIEFKKLSK